MRTILLSAIIGILTGFFIGFKFYSSKVEDLSSTVSSLTQINEDYYSSTKKQNNAVLSMRIAADYRRAQYEELLAKPEAVKYIHLKSNECEDIRSVLDDIRSSGF